MLILKAVRRSNRGSPICHGVSVGGHRRTVRMPSPRPIDDRHAPRADTSSMTWSCEAQWEQVRFWHAQYWCCVYQRKKTSLVLWLRLWQCWLPRLWISAMTWFCLKLSSWTSMLSIMPVEDGRRVGRKDAAEEKPGRKNHDPAQHQYYYQQWHQCPWEVAMHKLGSAVEGKESDEYPLLPLFRSPDACRMASNCGYLECHLCLDICANTSR